MMSNRLVDPLFQLIHSLEKAEKRHFKLYIKRNSAKEDLKIIQLFDAIAALPEYDDRILLKKLSSIEKPQLANLKTHLYKQVLASLRLLKSNDSVDLQLHEQLDYARILYSKGLYYQSLKILDKAKFVGSTKALLDHVQKSPVEQFIVATEAGILYQMKQAVPNKLIIPAPALESNSCACSECPYMKMNTLEKLYNALYYELPEIQVKESTQEGALKALNNMLSI